jgi:hypothetical protein
LTCFQICQYLPELGKTLVKIPIHGAEVMAYKRAGVEAARRPDRALHVAALFGALLLYASAALCQESPSPSPSPSSSPSPVGDLRADVDLNDVSAESALRFLADEKGEKGAGSN